VKFLLDECAPHNIVGFLKREGHSIQTLLDLKKKGIVNGDVAILAKKFEAILITRDSDFLYLKKSLQKFSRIIVLKIHPPKPDVIISQLQKFLSRCIDFLKEPGKVLITNHLCKLYKPDEKIIL
jgi:predicted nuclease of predicted toxin-antitoxin system